MKIKLDENLPFRLVSSLSALGHDVDTVQQEGLAGSADPEVWSAAQHESRFFITQDLDFSNVELFKPGTHAGLLLVRLRDPSAAALLSRIEHVMRTENVTEWSGCLVVLGEHKIRVRRAPTGGS